jgi:hypothetical protein
MAYEAQALVTSLAKQRTAQMWAYGTSFMVKYFEFSAGGHDPSDDTTALAPDPAATALSGTVLFGPEQIDSLEWNSISCPTFVCVIEQGEYAGELSSIGLIAEIVYVGGTDPDPPVVGTQFLFAVYNRPKLILTSTDGPTTFKLTPFL